MSTIIRTYRELDLEGIVAMLNAADAHDQTLEGTSVDEIREYLTMPGLVPEENVLVAQVEDGSIVGYATLKLSENETESTFRTFFQVHPEYRHRGLEQELAARLEARARLRMGECRNTDVDIATYVNGTVLGRKQLLDSLGWSEIRRTWLMVQPTLIDLPRPQFPEGILARAYCVGGDDVRMHQADSEAFLDHWAHEEQPLEHWKHYVALPWFRPDLTIVAEDPARGEIAGFCTIAVNVQENQRLHIEQGWIDILAVRRPYRRQGLGTALILAGMHNLRTAGLTQAVLGCDSQNLTGATRIYMRVGFHVKRERIIMNKWLRRAPALVPAKQAEAIRQSPTQIPP